MARGYDKIMACECEILTCLFHQHSDVVRAILPSMVASARRRIVWLGVGLHRFKSWTGYSQDLSLPNLTDSKSGGQILRYTYYNFDLDSFMKPTYPILETLKQHMIGSWSGSCNPLSLRYTDAMASLHLHGKARPGRLRDWRMVATRWCPSAISLLVYFLPLTSM